MTCSMAETAVSIETAFGAYSVLDGGRCGCASAIDCTHSRERVEFSPSVGIGDLPPPLLGGHSLSAPSAPASSSVPLGDRSCNVDRYCPFELVYALRNGPSTRWGASLLLVRGGGLSRTA